MSIELATDGEKHAERDVPRLFIAPPGVPLRFARSSMVVGSRGAGKTLLLRYQKITHEGVSAYFSLTNAVGAMTKQLGQGALSYESPGTEARAVSGKAVSLLATAMLDKFCFEKDLELSADVMHAFRMCLPADVRVLLNRQRERSDFDDVRERILRLPIEHFTGLADDSPQRELLAEFGNQCERLGRPLLVLFDKTDQVVSAAVVPVVELLNQSTSYVAVLAVRPGYTGRALDEQAQLIGPGDHYHVYFLGNHPRSDEWRAFTGAVLTRHLTYSGTSSIEFERVSESSRNWIHFISRDSLKLALRLISRGESNSALVSGLREEQALLKSSAMAMLPKYFPRSDDFDAFLRNIQREVQAHDELAVRPIHLAITKELAKDLFDANENLDRFLDGGLRCGAFCSTEGSGWVPGTHLREVEISPLLARRFDLLPERCFESTSVVLSKAEKELRPGGARSTKPPTVFIAYRMNSTESKAFKKNLESAMRGHTSLRSLQVVDGHANVGHKDWALQVRDKIRVCKLVVGDVTGLRNDVMFEMGFADGLSRPTICVTENRELVGAFPAWLTRGQLGSFEDGETMRHLLNGMATILGNARLLRRRPAHGTSPERIVWLRDAQWAQQAKAEFSRLVQSDGRTLIAFDDTQLDPTCLQQASTATLMVGILDGTDADVFVHYTCGIMMADPKAGWGPTKKLARQAIIVLPDHLEAKTVAPKSALHCHPTITYCHASELRAHAIDALRRYQEWSIPENGRSK